MIRSSIVTALVVAASLAASQALAQTGPVADMTVDVDGKLNRFALILIPVVLIGVLMLFEPWKWPKKLAEWKKRRDFK